MFSHFFISLNNIVSNNLSFLPFLLCWNTQKIVAQGPRPKAKEGALGQMSKNFQVYFICINFFEKPNKKIYNRAKEWYCDATIFVIWFFIVYLPEKNGNWRKAQGCRLSPTFVLPLFLGWGSKFGTTECREYFGISKLWLLT